MAENAPQVTPADARTFLGGFGHSPDALKAMGDPDVLKLHGTVKSSLDNALVAHTKGQPAWSEKWRETIAGDDKDAMGTLSRFTDPGAMFKSYRELRGKMDKGELRSVAAYPEKGTPEEQSAWRKERGIPEKHDAYDLNLGEGRVIGEADKPIVESFLKHAHGNNFAPEHVKAALGWYLDHQDELAEQRSNEDGEYKKKTEDTLRQEWGTNFRTYQNALKAMVDAAPAGLKERIIGARLADGRALLGDADAVKWLLAMQLAANPGTTLVPGEGAAQLQNLESEIRGIEKMMGTRAYTRDEAKQGRYRELVDAYQRLAGKPWGKQAA